MIVWLFLTLKAGTSIVNKGNDNGHDQSGLGNF